MVSFNTIAEPVAFLPNSLQVTLGNTETVDLYLFYDLFLFSQSRSKQYDSEQV